MPWVYAASVRRRWPDALVVNIEEQRPVARWGLDGFLNHEGEYFPGDFSDRWADLARLEGPEGSEVAMTRRYQNLESLLAPTGLQVVALHEDVLGQVTAGWTVVACCSGRRKPHTTNRSLCDALARAVAGAAVAPS